MLHVGSSAQTRWTFGTSCTTSTSSLESTNPL